MPAIVIALGKSTDIVPDVVIVPPDTVKLLLAIVTPVTVPPDVVVEMVTLPLLPLTLIPVPALILVTPVLVTVMLPEVVIGLLVTSIPAPGVIPTLVTVPETVLLAMFVTLPYVSTVTVGFVYCPAIIPVVGKFNTMLPELIIGVFVTVSVLEVIPTLLTPPPLPPLDAVIMIFPGVGSDRMILLSPAVKLNTPVLSIFNVPAVAFAVNVTPFPVKVLYGLALLNSVVKLSLVLVKAVINESLPVDSFGAPIAMICMPVIAILSPYSVFIRIGLNV